MAQMPTLRRERLASSYLYYYARADDARLTLTLVRTAAIDHGAVVVNGTPVVRIAKGPDGRATGVVVDAGGHRIEVAAGAVVNAAGVWSDDVRALDEGANPGSIRPAKGVHLTVPWDLVRNEIAPFLPVPGDKRSIFVVPWGWPNLRRHHRHRLRRPRRRPQGHPRGRGLRAAHPQRVADHRDHRGRRHRHLGRAAAPSAGKAASARTADLSRRNRVAGPSASGVVTITGGKLTTYREMAEDTIDHVVTGVLGADVVHRVMKRSRTRRLACGGPTATRSFARGPTPSAPPCPARRHPPGRGATERSAHRHRHDRARQATGRAPRARPAIRAGRGGCTPPRYEMARSVDERALEAHPGAPAGPATPRPASPTRWPPCWPTTSTGTRTTGRAGADYRAMVARERDAADLPEIVADGCGSLRP